MIPHTPAFGAIFTTAQKIILKNSVTGLLVRIVESKICSSNTFNAYEGEKTINFHSLFFCFLCMIGQGSGSNIKQNVLLQQPPHTHTHEHGY